MRHKVVHDDMTVDEAVVWRTATQELDPLIAEMEHILPSPSAGRHPNEAGPPA